MNYLKALNPINLLNQKKKKKTTNATSTKKDTRVSSSSSSSHSSPGLSSHVQDANAFAENPNSFVDVVLDKERKYIFTERDYHIISRVNNAIAIVNPFKVLFPNLFVHCKFSASGHYLNIFSSTPKSVDGKKAEAHISFHPINDLYHFKIIAFRKFNLPVPPEGKDYTISFKMHKFIDTEALSATIQPFVNNVETEVECPQPVINLLQLSLDIMVELLNRNRLGGVKTKRRKIKRRTRYNK